MCDHFGAVWLGAAPAPSRGALALAEQAAGARPAGSLAPAAVRIADAAAEVVRTGGLGGLTHRAVAACAGVTTGAVTHHFRSAEDLVAGAIRGQVQVMSRTGSAGDARILPVEQIRTRADLATAIRITATVDSPEGDPGLARRRLFLAALHRPQMAGAGAVIRFAHGGTVRDALERLFEIPPADLPLHAGVLSRLLAALRAAAAADASPQATREALAAEVLDRLLRRLAPRPGDRSAPAV